MEKNSDITLRGPESCSLSRTTAFNKQNVEIFFDKLKYLYQVYRCFADGSRVFNLGETYTTIVRKLTMYWLQKAQNKFHRFHPVIEGSW